jgi:hypothetical protein
VAYCCHFYCPFIFNKRHKRRYKKNIEKIKERNRREEKHVAVARKEKHNFSIISGAIRKEGRSEGEKKQC